MVSLSSCFSFWALANSSTLAFNWFNSSVWSCIFSISLNWAFNFSNSSNWDLSPINSLTFALKDWISVDGSDASTSWIYWVSILVVDPTSSVVNPVLIKFWISNWASFVVSVWNCS